MTTVNIQGLAGLNSRQLGAIAGLVEQIDGVLQQSSIYTAPYGKAVKAAQLMAAFANGKVKAPAPQPKRLGRKPFTPAQKVEHGKKMRKMWADKKRKGAPHKQIQAITGKRVPSGKALAAKLKSKPAQFNSVEVPS